MAQLVTPNIPEMEALSDMPLLTISDKYNAAKHLLSLGVQSVLLKGGHEEGEVKVDILYQKSPQGIITCSFSSDTLNTRNIHGTGCTLSSAIAAYMARGLALKEAISSAKIYITEAIKAGADISVGKGYGPVNHLFNPLKMMINEE